MAEIKYVKDHKSGNRFYPIVKSAGIIDAFNINEPQIDCLFGKVQSVSFANSSVSLNLNESAQLQLNLTSLGTVDYDDFQWESSHPEVATVDKGLVTAVSKGSTTIRAYSPFYERESSMQIFVASDPNDINIGTPTWYIKYKAKEPSRFLYFGIKNWESEVKKMFLDAEVSENYDIASIQSIRSAWLPDDLNTSELDTCPSISLVQDLYDQETKEGIIGFENGTQYAAPIGIINFTNAAGEQTQQLFLQPFNGVAITEKYQFNIEDYNITHLDVPGDKKYAAMIIPVFTALCALEDVTFRGHTNLQNIDTLFGSISKVAPFWNQVYIIKKDWEYTSLYRSIWDFDSGRKWAWFQGIKVEDGHPKLDSRDDCNAVIETATNTLIIGTNITQIPSSVTALGHGAFIEVEMENLVIPSSVTSIEAECFHCATITNLTIPETITIAQDAFTNGATITNVYYGGTMEQWQNMNITMSSYPTIHCSDGTI